MNASQEGAALVVEDSDNALLDNIVIAGEQQPGRGIEYRIRTDRKLGALRIRNVVAPDVKEVGIALENLSKDGSLESYLITGNVATVKAELTAGRHLVDGNL